jgi:hypothetical protein
MAALQPQRFLVPAAGRFDVADSDQRLRLHNSSVSRVRGKTCLP